MQNPQLNHRHLVGTPLSSSAPTTSESSVHFNPHLMQYDSILPIDLFPYLCWFVANWPFLASLQSLPINFYHPFPMYCRESIILNHIPRVESRRGGAGGGRIKVQRTATNDCNFCAACPPSIITQRCGGVSLCYMPATNVTSIAVSPAPAFLSPSAPESPEWDAGNCNKWAKFCTFISSSAHQDMTKLSTECWWWLVLMELTSILWLHLHSISYRFWGSLDQNSGMRNCYFFFVFLSVYYRRRMRACNWGFVEASRTIDEGCERDKKQWRL